MGEIQDILSDVARPQIKEKRKKKSPAALRGQTFPQNSHLAVYEVPISNAK